MSNFYGTQMNKLRNSQPVQLPASGDVAGRLRIFNEKVDLSAQAIASGDTIEIAKLPKNARLLYGHLSSTVSLGTATIAIGITGAGNKYRNAATFTTPDQPTLFGNVANIGEALTGEEIILLTVGAAALPNAGILRVMLYYTLD